MRRLTTFAVLGVVLAFVPRVNADDKTDLQKLQGEVEELRKQADKERQDWQQAFDELKETLDGLKAVSEAKVKEAQAREEESKALAKLVQETRKDLQKVQEQANDLKMKLTIAEVELQAQHKQDDRIEKLLLEIVKPRQAVEVPAVQRPEFEIHGKISGIADAGFFIIAAGTEAGIERGQVLDVHRSGDARKQVGTMTIMRSYNKQSLGQFSSTGKDRAEVGDDVTNQPSPK